MAEHPDISEHLAPDELQSAGSGRFVTAVREYAFSVALVITCFSAGLLFHHVRTLEAIADAYEITPPPGYTPQKSFYLQAPRDSQAVFTFAESDILWEDESLQASLPDNPVQAVPATQLRQVPSRAPRQSQSRASRTAAIEPVRPRSIQPEARAASVASRATGTLTVQVQPWGRVFINGQLAHQEAHVPFKKKLPADRYDVTVVHPVLGTWKGVARVEAGREVAVFVNFNTDASGDDAERRIHSW